MPTLFKREQVEFREDPGKIDHYRLFTAFPRMGTAANSKNLVFDLRMLNPGQFSFPYHFHHASEEMMMVINGTMTLRSPRGFEIMGPGDIVFFETGESGAHQFYNHSEEPCTYLDVRTLFGIDISEYPDSGKVNLVPFMHLYEKDKKVSYFEGEENVLQKWNELKAKSDKKKARNR
jgi:uncharacterized cupin superfamily protein